MTIQTDNYGIGASGTASQKFTFTAPNDGTFKLGRGVLGAESSFPIVVNADDSITFAGGISNKNQCTAWVNFNGTGTVDIRDSFNVSSITDNGTGYYTVNFATAMATANYAVALTCGPAGGASPNPPLVATSNLTADVAPTTGGFAIATSTSPTSLADYARVNAVVFGGN